MAKVECPRCNQETISLKQKILTNKWIDVFCPNCGTRLCAQPTVLALLSFLLTWNIIYFGYLTVREASLTFGILFVVGWLLIEVFMYYIPLCALRAKHKPDTDASE